MLNRRHPPLDETRKHLKAALRDLQRFEETLGATFPPTTPEEDERPIGVLLNDLQGVRRRLQQAMETIAASQQSPSRSERREALIRKLPRIGIRAQRQEASPDVVSAQEMEAAAALARERMRLAAELHDEAAKIVGETLERSTRREQEAARSNPEIGPFLSAYFDASRRSLLQSTSELLDTSLFDPQRANGEEKPNHGPA
jgi:hypothetical protein